MNRKRVVHFRALIAAGLLYLAATTCHADFIFTVTVDTAPLIGHPAGPFSLEFQLNDGSGTNDGNNTALLSDFDFHGGNPVGPPTLIGGASGDLGSNIVLADNDFLNEFFQEFTPGPLLTFTVDLSLNVDAGPQPDEFTFAILDCTLIEIPTLGPADSLVLVDVTGNPVVQTFAGNPSRPTGCGGEPVFIPAPTLDEPPSLPLAFAALFALAPAIRRPSRSSRRIP
jgi:hypothetical protein